MKKIIIIVLILLVSIGYAFANMTCFGKNGSVCVGEDINGNGFLLLKSANGGKLYLGRNPIALSTDSSSVFGFVHGSTAESGLSDLQIKRGEVDLSGILVDIK